MGSKVIFELDLDINKFDKKFENKLSEGFQIKTEKLKKEFNSNVKIIEQAKNDIAAKNIAIHQSKTKEYKSRLEQSKKADKKALKEAQHNVREINKERKGLFKLEKQNEFITFKTSFGDFNASKKTLVKNLGNNAEYIKQRLKAQVRKYKRREENELDEIKKVGEIPNKTRLALLESERDELNKLKGLKPTKKNLKLMQAIEKSIDLLSLNKASRKVVVDKRENNIELFQSIIDQITYEPDYPIFYDYFPGENKFELHIIGFKGISEYRKKQRQRKEKFSTTHRIH